MSNVLDEVIERLEPLPGMVSVMVGSKRPVLLGLDIGTSGVRAALFDGSGDEITGASVRIDRSGSDTTNFALLDPEGLLEQVAITLDALFLKLDDSTTRIELIAISCFWHSLVGVDERGNATTQVLGWADLRAVEATHQLRSEFDESKTHARTGCRFHPSYWPAKLRRLRNEEPEIFRATKQWLSFADYLTLQFFGETAVSLSMASATGLLNQHTCQWDEELLEALDVTVASLPEIAAPNFCFRKLSRPYAIRFGRN